MTLYQFLKCHFQVLEFTYELPNNGAIKFLDVMIFEGERHTCWECAVGGDKGILKFDSGHSKLVKRSVAYACLLNSCQKSCAHTLARRLMNQVDRLRKSDYPDAMISSLAEVLSQD